MRRALPLTLALAATLLAAPLAAQGNPEVGLWSPPRDSLVVETAPCGEGLCGVVVRAIDEAKADARKAGTEQLIGLHLLSDFRRVDARTWRGRIFVPDMGRTVSSTIEQLSNDELSISGCLLGRFFCKTQLWHRVK